MADVLIILKEIQDGRFCKDNPEIGIQDNPEFFRIIQIDFRIILKLVSKLGVVSAWLCNNFRDMSIKREA